MISFRQLLEPVLVSKLLSVGLQFLFVILCTVLSEQVVANTIFKILSWSSIIVAISSLGASAALSKYLSTTNELKKVVLMVLTSRAVVIVLVANVIDFMSYEELFKKEQVIFCSFMLSLMFLDYVFESRSISELEIYCKIKILCAIIAFVVKMFMIYFHSLNIYYIVYLEILMVFILCLFCKSLPLCQTGGWFPNYKEFKSFLYFSCSSSWLWVSGVLNLSWSRGSFLVLSNSLSLSEANVYFNLVRVIESLSFLQNSISSKYFSKYLNSYCNDERARMKNKFAKDIVYSSLLSSLVVFTFSLIILYYFNVDFALVTVMAVLSSLFYSLRQGLSREIILSGQLSSSFYSYTCALIFGLASYLIIEPTTIASSMVCYFIFTFILFITGYLALNKYLRGYFEI